MKFEKTVSEAAMAKLIDYASTNAISIHNRSIGTLGIDEGNHALGELDLIYAP